MALSITGSIIVYVNTKAAKIRVCKMFFFVVVFMVIYLKEYYMQHYRF